MTLTELSDWLRDLHEAAIHLDSAALRSWVLERIRPHVPFDSAWWAVGTTQDGDLPDDVIVAGRKARMPEETGSQANAASRVSWYCEPARTPRPRMVLAFSRGADAAPFGDGERELLELLASQACVAWRCGEQQYFLQQLRPPQQVAALADRRGGIRAVTGNFYAALRASWPDWQGDQLPAPLCASSASGAALSVRSYRWSVADHGERLVVTARPLGVIAALTSHQKSVAAAVLDAGSLREAAMQLRISQHSVRNTLARIYDKLGVRNRVELAMRFRQALAGSESMPD
jgi:DNA-binding CsgD family transcriptional regulator